MANPPKLLMRKVKKAVRVPLAPANDTVAVSTTPSPSNRMTTNSFTTKRSKLRSKATAAGMNFTKIVTLHGVKVSRRAKECKNARQPSRVDSVIESAAPTLPPPELDVKAAPFSATRPHLQRGPSFFDKLPRELRDQIYEESLTKETGVQLPKGSKEQYEIIHARIRHSANIGLLLANRQMHTEYLDIVRKGTTLVLEDHEEYRFAIPSLTSDARLVTVRHLQLLLYIYCPCCDHSGRVFCKAASEVASHLKWISATVEQLPELRDVRIECHMQCCPCVRGGPLLSRNAELSEEVKKLVALPKLTTLEVMPYDYHHKEVYRGKEYLLMSWSKKGGLKEHGGSRSKMKGSCNLY